MPSVFTLPFLLMHITLLTLLQFPSCLYALGNYTACGNLFNCGKVSNLGFPFWGEDRPRDCGYPELNLECSDDSTILTIKGVRYSVLDANPGEHVLRIARLDYEEDLCPEQLLNTSLDPKVFEFVPHLKNLTLLYGCLERFHFENVGQFSCHKSGLDNEYGNAMLDKLIPPGFSESCNTSVVVPIDVPMSIDDVLDLEKVKRAIRDGFEVKWIAGIVECDECQNSGGVCGFDPVWNQFNCSSRTIYDATPPGPPGEKSSRPGVIAGIAVGVAAAVCIFLGCVCFVVRQKKRIVEGSKSKDLFMPPSSGGAATSTTNTSHSVPSYTSSRSESLQQSFFYGVKVFTYTELEEATKNFDPSMELGNGGFGIVYYGTLKDGRAVAVKRLYETNWKRVEQFKNEVEILARLQHNNLVALYGCTSRHSRELLLVYEYIPNGTVADHLHGNRAKSALLPWSTRLNIAVETADALAFLHRSDVIHRDVKTNNILLDHKFRVKVADFGLSRLFPNDVTHVSTAPQGTPGYVDPEYYQCYQLTNKSDVYSFGVVLVELISSLEAVDINRHRHEINLANLAVNKIHNHEVHKLVDPSLGFERDSTIRRMTTTVAELAFRCLQQDREMRPSMAEVLEVLRGIQKEEYGEQVAAVVNNRTDEVMLLKNVHPPVSPDSVADNWVSCSTTSSSS